MKRAFDTGILVLAIMIGFAATNSVMALDAAYNIGPVKDYDPQTGRYNPFFPIGWFTYGPVADLKEMASHGCNMVHFADIGASDWHFNYTKSQLDLAEKVGLKIEISFFRNLVTAVRKNDPSTHAAILNYVNAFKNHPALLGWHIGDEMHHSQTQCVVDTAAIIRAADPHNPISQVHSLSNNEKQIDALMAGTDVAQFDYYAIFKREKEFLRASALLNLFRWRSDWCSNNGWGGNVHVTQAVGRKIGDGDYRFPTYNEYRWNMYSALASAGSRGFLNWIYYCGKDYYPDPKVFHDFRDKVVRPNLKELNMLTHALETGYNVGKVTSNGDTCVPGLHYNQVSHLLIHDDKSERYFLIVTNNTDASKLVRITLSDLPYPLSHLRAKETVRGKAFPIKDLGGGKYQIAMTIRAYGANVYILNRSSSR